MSLAPNGTPWSGPRNVPRAASSVAWRAARRAPSRSTSAHAWMRPSIRSMRSSSASTRSTGESTFSRIARAASTASSVCRLTTRPRGRRPAPRRPREETSPPRSASPRSPRSSGRAPGRARPRAAARRRLAGTRRTRHGDPHGPLPDHLTSDQSSAFELHILVRAGPREAGVEPDGRDDHLVLDELLDLVQRRFTPFGVELVGLLLEQAVDIGIVAINVRAAADDEGLDPGRGVAEGATGAVDEPLVALLGPPLEVGCPLDRAEPHANAGRIEVVDHGLADVHDRSVAEVVAGVEAVG